jgi:hypothetical protein
MVHHDVAHQHRDLADLHVLYIRYEPPTGNSQVAIIGVDHSSNYVSQISAHLVALESLLRERLGAEVTVEPAFTYDSLFQDNRIVYRVNCPQRFTDDMRVILAYLLHPKYAHWAPVTVSYEEDSVEPKTTVRARAYGEAADCLLASSFTWHAHADTGVEFQPRRLDSGPYEIVAVIGAPYSKEVFFRLIWELRRSGNIYLDGITAPTAIQPA